MFHAIGTGKSGAPLVLAELNDYEKAALTDILWSAERALEAGTANHGRRRNDGMRVMIAELRRAYEIEAD
jgi:hypothetical protein